MWNVEQNLMNKKRCVKWPFCWKLAVGYIERKFVMKQRYFICEKHGKIAMEAWEENSWSGEDWSSQEFIRKLED